MKVRNCYSKKEKKKKEEEVEIAVNKSILLFAADYNKVFHKHPRCLEGKLDQLSPLLQLSPRQ
jgi:hypothetical protein